MLYKKIYFEKLLPKLKKPKYKKFFKLYISDYLSKTNPKIIDIASFISYCTEALNLYKTLDKQAQIYFHTLQDSKIIAIEKTLFISCNAFTHVYPQLRDLNLLNNTYLLYGSNLYIDPEYSGIKLCIKLKKLVNKFAESINVSYIVVDINTVNYPSIKCNENAGFNATKIISHKNTLFYINKLKVMPTSLKKYIIGINYELTKNFIPKKFFTMFFNTNKNWVEEITLTPKQKQINFLYNVGCKNLYKLWPDIGNIFMTSHRETITNKSALVETIMTDDIAFYKKYMMPTAIISDIENLHLYKKLFKKNKIYILRPTWGWTRNGIKIFSKFDDFNNFMNTEGINEQNKAITDKNRLNTAEPIHYILSEFLQNQLLFNSKVFNLRVFFMITFVNNKYRGYMINPIVMHVACKKKSTNYNDIHSQISSTGECGDFIFDDLVKEIGTLKGNCIMHQIIKILSKLFNIISTKKLMKKWYNMKNAYEIFGLDFIMSDKYAVKLVEFNDRIGINDWDVIYENMAAAIINGTINKLYDDRYKINISKKEFIRIK
jgi:hypothetical protein